MRLALRLPFLGLVAVAAAGLLAGCATSRPFVADLARESLRTPEAAVPDADYQVFLLGDVGAPGDPAPVLDALAARLREAGPNSAVVFLGDQLPAGLPDSGAAGREEAEARLRQLAAAVQGYEGRVVVVPGDRDWRGGPDAVRRQQALVDGLLGREGAFLPGDGLPGPVVVELGGDAAPVLVALDTQWWLEPAEARPVGEVDDVDVATPGDVAQALQDVLARHDDTNVLVVGHHPLRSNGPRAGRYPLTTHLLPPVLGSLLPLYRTFIGSPQDLNSPRYRAFRRAMEGVLRTHNGVVYAAAHEHALQAFRVSGIATRRHFVVSGAAADADRVAPGFGALYAHGTRGFLVLRYAADGRVALEAVEVDAAGARAAPVANLRGQIQRRLDPQVPTAVDPAALPGEIGGTVTAVADPDLGGGPIKRLFFGSGYRAAWTTPVEAPVLDLGRDYGGLTPIRRGGGLQSTSIRFLGGDGREYQLRLLRKRAAEALPPEFQTPLIRDAVADQTSATLPYASLAVSALAEALGVYHAPPRLVYVPDDPRLGRYREALAGQLATIELRPTDDVSAVPTLGGARDIDSPSALVRNLREDRDHRVDQRAFLRARLLDLAIGDWDRHSDQWRWAVFEPFELDPTLEGDARTQGKVYRPIPRDRDFAFYRIGGLFPRFARFVEPKFQPFGPRYGSMVGLTHNAVPLDRRFLSELEWADWEAEIAAVRATLTPDVVDAALRRWPAPVYARYGRRTARDLQTRLDHLHTAGRRFYRLLARSPDVVGSDERERFVVNRNSDGTTEVVVHAASGEGEPRRELFRRTFDPRHTREVRLYGLGGRDWLVVEGPGPARILIRFIGGAGDDTVIDRTRAGGVAYYDDERGNDTREAASVALRPSDDPSVNRYEPAEFDRYPAATPYPTVGYNSTDGALIGVGLLIHRPRFRAAPTSHDVQVRIASHTGGVDGRYAYRDADRLGRGHGLALDLEGATPRSARNFYGFGNETPNGGGATFYRVPVAYLRGEGAYVRRLADAIHLRLGPAGAYTDVRRDTTRFAASPGAGLPADAFEPQIHGGGAGALTLERVDIPTNPRQGVRIGVHGAAFAPLNAAADAYGTLGGDLVVYVSPNYSPQLTLALRVGGAHALGDVPFFDAPALGGLTLRGYRRERFTGRTAFYQSAELRGKLLDLSTALLPFELGALAFVDNGRVWADGESSSTWHQGYGGGLWLGFVNRAVVTAMAGQSPEGTVFLLRLGFAY